MKEIPLSQGYKALVDDTDFERVSQLKWYVDIKRHKDGTIKYLYASTSTYVNREKAKMRLHRFVLGVTDPSIQVDHEDHNGLNCQRYNLRKCSPQQNQANQRRATSSKLKGISWHKANKNWRAQIMVAGKFISLGSFTDPLEAACAYDMAAVKHFGSFSSCNFAICD